MAAAWECRKPTFSSLANGVRTSSAIVAGRQGTHNVGVCVAFQTWKRTTRACRPLPEYANCNLRATCFDIQGCRFLPIFHEFSNYDGEKRNTAAANGGEKWNTYESSAIAKPNVGTPAAAERNSLRESELFTEASRSKRSKGLGTNAAAPASRASSRIISSEFPLTITTAVEGDASRMRLHSSIPLNSGISTSVITSGKAPSEAIFRASIGDDVVVQS